MAFFDTYGTEKKKKYLQHSLRIRLIFKNNEVIFELPYKCQLVKIFQAKL